MVQVLTAAEVEKKLLEAFDGPQASLLAHLYFEAFSQLVRTGDFLELKLIVKELAEAQKRTELRIEELAEAQKRTEARVAELAEAQKRTEACLADLTAVVRGLAGEIHTTRQELGGLSATVGYTLENEAYRALPRLLLRDYRLAVQGKLKRAWVADKLGRSIEVNILGKGERDGREVTIVGESKSQLSKNKVDSFMSRKVSLLKEVLPDPFPVIVTHMISEPDVEEYARGQGVAVYYSYDFGE